MSTIERVGENFVVPADLLAKALRLDESEIKRAMRNGRITSRSEAGLHDDAGLWRLTFYYADQACRFVIDDSGTVVRRATFPARTRASHPHPESRNTGGEK